MTSPSIFDERAPGWDEEPRRIALACAIANAMIDALLPEPDWDLLDFGCGTGLVTLRLFPHVRSITGADSSRGMLDALDAKLAARGITTVRTVLTDHRALELTGGYHCVISSMTLHHVEDVPAFLTRMHALLRPGGRLAIADLDPDGGLFHPDPTGVHHEGFDRDTLRRWCAEAGFTDVRITTAATTRRPQPDGTTREFSILLLTALAKAEGAPDTARRATGVDASRSSVAGQFDAAITMLANAIEACPDALWDQEAGGQVFRELAFHTLIYLDLYLSESEETFRPCAPTIDVNVCEEGLFPTRRHSREDMLAHVAACRAKCAGRIAALTDAEAWSRCGFPWLDLTVFDMLLYNMRHVQHHAGQLNLLLRQAGGAVPRWVRGA